MHNAQTHPVASSTCPNRSARPPWNPFATPAPDTIDAPMANLMQHAITERNLISENLLRVGDTGIEPLPPPQIYAHQNMAPDLPLLPASQRDNALAPFAHDHWLATAVHSLAAATAALAQSIYAHAFASPTRRNRPQRVTPPPVEPDGEPAHLHVQADAIDQDSAGRDNFTEEADIDIAIAADHLRHTARIVQQLTAALSVHLAFCTNDLLAPPAQVQQGTSHSYTHQPFNDTSASASGATNHALHTHQAAPEAPEAVGTMEEEC